MFFLGLSRTSIGKLGVPIANERIVLMDEIIRFLLCDSLKISEFCGSFYYDRPVSGDWSCTSKYYDYHAMKLATVHPVQVYLQGDFF